MVVQQTQFAKGEGNPGFRVIIIEAYSHSQPTSWYHVHIKSVKELEDTSSFPVLLHAFDTHGDEAFGEISRRWHTKVKSDSDKSIILINKDTA